MLHKNKIPNPFNHKKKYINKKRNLSSWLNDYEIQAYATEEMKKEIKELLFDVYDKDKDIKDIKEQFYTKYVNCFSDSINERSIHKEIESLYKRDIPFVTSEKNELKEFIENRNKVLKEKENEQKKNRNYSDFWTENKTIKNDLFDFNDDEYNKAIKKRNKSNRDYIDDKKRNNSKVRDYAKKRYQIMNKYTDFFSNEKDNCKNNDKNNKKIIKKDYYYNEKYKKTNNKNNKNRCINKTPSFLNFHNYSNKNKKKCMTNNTTRLLLFNQNNKKKGKNEIKVRSRKNKYINKEQNTNNDRYNNNNIDYDKEVKYNEKEIDTKYINELILNNNNLNNGKDYKVKINVYNEDSLSSKSLNKYTDDYLGDNIDEIKKIKVNGVKYRINGEPKKEEINEEIIVDKNIIKNENNEPNKESKLVHKKLIITKNIEDKENDVNLVQKIEKDIKESKTRISSIPKESLRKFLYDNDIKTNNSYKIIYYKENEIFGMNPFSDTDKEKDINKYKNNNTSYKTINTNKSYNEGRIDRKNNYKKNYENEINKNNENKNNYFRGDNEYKEIKVNRNEKINNFNNYKYNNRIFNSEIIEKIENKDENIKEGIKEFNNNLINNSANTNIFGNKRKRFHRLINFSDTQSK
jgi:hypothetical protein